MDTAEQLMQNNITLYNGPGGQILKQILLQSTIHEYNKLGENIVFADSWDHFYDMTGEDVIGAGTHALMGPYVGGRERAMGRWYRSEERVSGVFPYGGYLTNKKWHLNEVTTYKVTSYKQFFT